MPKTEQHLYIHGMIFMSAISFLFTHKKDVSILKTKYFVVND